MNRLSNCILALSSSDLTTQFVPEKNPLLLCNRQSHRIIPYLTALRCRSLSSRKSQQIFSSIPSCVHRLRFSFPNRSNQLQNNGQPSAGIPRTGVEKLPACRRPAHDGGGRAAALPPSAAMGCGASDNLSVTQCSGKIEAYSRQNMNVCVCVWLLCECECILCGHFSIWDIIMLIGCEFSAIATEQLRKSHIDRCYQ